MARRQKCPAAARIFWMETGFGASIWQIYSAGARTGRVFFRSLCRNELNFRRKMNMAVVATASGGGAAGMIGMIVWIVLLFGLMWFLMIRPQKKEQKRLAAMLADMEVGDAVVTTSGFYGVVIDITDEDVIVEFGNNKNCRIPMRKSAIAEVEKAADANA